jgi:uncharacterized protein YjbJ (UPF0337 family)
MTKVAGNSKICIGNSIGNSMTRVSGNTKTQIGNIEICMSTAKETGSAKSSAQQQS